MKATKQSANEKELHSSGLQFKLYNVERCFIALNTCKHLPRSHLIFSLHLLILVASLRKYLYIGSGCI